MVTVGREEGTDNLSEFDLLFERDKLRQIGDEERVSHKLTQIEFEGPMFLTPVDK